MDCFEITDNFEAPCSSIEEAEKLNEIQAKTLIATLQSKQEIIFYRYPFKPVKVLPNLLNAFRRDVYSTYCKWHLDHKEASYATIEEWCEDWHDCGSGPASILDEPTSLINDEICWKWAFNILEFGLSEKDGWDIRNIYDDSAMNIELELWSWAYSFKTEDALCLLNRTKEELVAEETAREERCRKQEHNEGVVKEFLTRELPELILEKVEMDSKQKWIPFIESKLKNLRKEELSAILELSPPNSRGGYDSSGDWLTRDLVVEFGFEISIQAAHQVGKILAKYARKHAKGDACTE